MEEYRKKVWMSTPTYHSEEIDYITKAILTNWKSTVGENIDEVERLVCEKTGCRYAVALINGTAAIHMAVLEAGVMPGDHVFCSDMTFCATVNPVVYAGGIPVFIDSEYETWNMDPIALEKAFSLYPDTKVVICANLYGTPAKLDEIRGICDRHGAVLIEDAAESFGATYKGRQTGSFGQYNIISFNGNKIITGSTGGCFITDDKNAAEHVRKLSTQAKEPSPWYQHDEIGYNYRISNIIAGVIRGQMLYLDEHIAQKKAVFRRYRDAFADLPLSMNPHPAGCEPNYWLSCILIDKDAMLEQKRSVFKSEYTPEQGKTCPDEIYQKLAQMNIESRPIWKPMHMQPVFDGSPVVTVCDDFSVCEDIFERGLCLPSDNKMEPGIQAKVVEIIKQCFN